MTETIQYNLLSNAKKIQKHIVLPEGNDDRILTAASQIAEDKVAKITILGDPEKVNKRWEEWLEYEGEIIKSYGNKETIHG